MSESLHPEYLMRLSSNIPAVEGRLSTESYIFFSPSGLVLHFFYLRTGGYTSFYYNPANNSITASQAIITDIKWMSTTEKTYEFLDSLNRIVFTIPKSAWYKSSSSLYQADCAFHQQNNTYYLGYEEPVSISCSKILYIDFSQWSFKDNVTGIDSLTMKEKEFFPLYKEESSDKYYLSENGVFEPNKTYSLLSSIGALYQYDQTEKLNIRFARKKNFSSEVTHNSNVIIQTAEDIPNYLSETQLIESEDHPRYSASQSKYIYYDWLYSEESDKYRDKNSHLIRPVATESQRYSVSKPFIIFDNSYDYFFDQNILVVNNRPFVWFLDYTHVWILTNKNDYLWRIPYKWHGGIYRRDAINMPGATLQCSREGDVSTPLYTYYKTQDTIGDNENPYTLISEMDFSFKNTPETLQSSISTKVFITYDQEHNNWLGPASKIKFLTNLLTYFGDIVEFKKLTDDDDPYRVGGISEVDKIKNIHKKNHPTRHFSISQWNLDENNDLSPSQELAQLWQWKWGTSDKSNDMVDIQYFLNTNEPSSDIGWYYRKRNSNRTENVYFYLPHHYIMIYWPVLPWQKNKYPFKTPSNTIASHKVVDSKAGQGQYYSDWQYSIDDGWTEGGDPGNADVFLKWRINVWQGSNYKGASFLDFTTYILPSGPGICRTQQETTILTKLNKENIKYGNIWAELDYNTGDRDVERGLSAHKQIINNYSNTYWSVVIYPNEYIEVTYNYTEGPMISLTWNDYNIIMPQSVGTATEIDQTFWGRINSSECFTIVWSDGTVQYVNPSQVNHSESGAVTRIYHS